MHKIHLFNIFGTQTQQSFLELSMELELPNYVNNLLTIVQYVKKKLLKKKKTKYVQRKTFYLLCCWINGRTRKKKGKFRNFHLKWNSYIYNSCFFLTSFIISQYKPHFLKSKKKNQQPNCIILLLFAVRNFAPYRVRLS